LRLHTKLAGETGGEVVGYIPELLKARPEWFGISIATVDEAVYSIGEADLPFTIQSVSKPYLYGYALREYGREFVLDHIGVEPTGEAFNAIVLDEVNNRRFNPMVNAAAMAVAELMKGERADERRQNMRHLFAQVAGHPLSVNDSGFRSEHATGRRNRGVAYMMLNSGMTKHDPEEILDLYFQQCSINVTCDHLAIMAATPANDGIIPKTGEAVLRSGNVRHVLTVMNSCDMYNYAGQWTYEVGIPAKSSVSGAIMAVIPGQLGIGVYSHPVDIHGNSIRGVRVYQEISDEFSLHVFNNRTNVRSVIRREYRCDVVNSKRLRRSCGREVLKRERKRIVVLELRGALFLGSVERRIRRVNALASEADHVVIDFKRVNLPDDAATKLVQRMATSLMPLESDVLMTHLGAADALSDLHQQMAAFEEAGGVRLFRDTDSALEWCEDRLLAEQPDVADRTKFALAQLNIF
jgi:glutaminase